MFSLIWSFFSLFDSVGAVGVLCFLGVLFSLYAFKIESTGDPKKRVAICDVGENASCTFVLTSKYGHMAKLMFGLSDKSPFNYSNAVYGMLFYVCAFCLRCTWIFNEFPFASFTFLLMTLASVCASLGLAWILYAKLHNLCMICVCTYTLNMLLFGSALVHFLGN